MAAERRASVTWDGDLASGSGRFSVDSGALGEQEVTWAARTESSDGKTSPEELIAAAFASCFSMALSGGLARAGTPPTRLETDAVATFDRRGEGYAFTTLALTVRGQVEGMDEDAFRAAAEQAKENCPVAQALKGNVEVSLDASLASS
jgi:osmotically inducible protein OsmC